MPLPGPGAVSDRRVGTVLSLLRQALELDVEFGTHSIESMVRIAEVVERSVYAAGSLRATPSGVRFVLENPPLRLGAFGAVRVRVDGAWIPPARTRLRTEGTTAWRTAQDVDRERPIVLLPGVPTEFEVDLNERPGRELMVRLELESVAIPPLVWFEFREPIAAESGP